MSWYFVIGKGNAFKERAGITEDQSNIFAKYWKMSKLWPKNCKRAKSEIFQGFFGHNFDIFNVLQNGCLIDLFIINQDLAVVLCN